MQQNHEFLSQWKQKVPLIAPVEKEQLEVLLTVISAIGSDMAGSGLLRGSSSTDEMESSKQAAKD